MSKKILVTGGTGFIGSHTVVELYNAGYTPIIIDNLSNSNIKILDQIEQIIAYRPAFYEFDLCDEIKTKEFIAQNSDIAGVIHFAAYKAVGESVLKPLEYYKNNFFSLINLLEAYKNKPVNFVFSSSCTVYGQPDFLPVSEDAPIKKAESPYGNTKQIAEEILQETCLVCASLDVIVLRYFNPVGAHHTALIGELPNGVPQNLVPFITQSAIGKRAAIMIYGDDYNTPDGSAIRDYIHVVDLAKAHVSAIKRLEEKRSQNYEVFNIGTGKGSSVLEIINAFEQSTGEKLNYTIGKRREGDIEQTFGDVAKANEILGWEATLDIKEMMNSAWNWEKYLRDNPF